LKKRLQTIENKRRECAKKRKERPKRLQTAENMGFATEAQRHRAGEIEVVHPRGDGKYGQVVEDGGDSVAAWRIRWREQKRSSDADVPPTPGVLQKEFGSY
jgi:hypothetical protein